MLLGLADEGPVNVETPAIAIAELVEDNAADFADAGGHLEEIDEILVGEVGGKRFVRGGPIRVRRYGLAATASHTFTVLRKGPLPLTMRAPFATD